MKIKLINKLGIILDRAAEFATNGLDLVINHDFSEPINLIIRNEEGRSLFYTSKDGLAFIPKEFVADANELTICILSGDGYEVEPIVVTKDNGAVMVQPRGVDRVFDKCIKLLEDTSIKSKIIATLEEQNKVLTSNLQSLQQDVAMLKQRINPIKDVL